jgi:hypothetical protein
MASATRPRVKAYVPAKRRAATISPAKKARKELLDDLMDDANKCLATKNGAEKKAFFHAIKKIAHS